MKKIAILTIQGENYGNRLQNYALQEYLTSLGFFVETIDDVTQRTLIEQLKCIIRCLLFKAYRNRIKGKPFENIRIQRFSVWNKKYIVYSSSTISRYYHPRKISSVYDYVVVGSDQVWNPYFYKDSRMLLPFIEPSKRVSYAASFGVTSVPQKYRKMFCRELKRFKAISVREKQAVDLVAELSGRKSEWVLDPTLLLDAQEWAKIEQQPEWKMTSKYILVYSLGELPEKIKNKVASLAEKKSLEIIEILDKTNKMWYTTNPSEFLYLIHYADLVVTDSFHATVFSLIFSTPYIIFQRNEQNMPEMNSRLSSLTELLDLPERSDIDALSDAEVFIVPKNRVNEILINERKKASAFLLNSLG